MTKGCEPAFWLSIIKLVFSERVLRRIHEVNSTLIYALLGCYKPRVHPLPWWVIVRGYTLLTSLLLLDNPVLDVAVAAWLVLEVH